MLALLDADGTVAFGGIGGLEVEGEGVGYGAAVAGSFVGGEGFWERGVRGGRLGGGGGCGCVGGHFEVG